MKKYLLFFITLLAMSQGAFCLTVEDIKTQILDKTEFTALKAGGPSMIYDFTDGTSGAFKMGATSHVLTNRFIQADASWVGGTDGHTAGLGIFGGSIVATDAIEYYFPSATSLIKALVIPNQLQGVWVGAGVGWGTDNWVAHWTVSLGKNF